MTTPFISSIACRLLLLGLFTAALSASSGIGDGGATRRARFIQLKYEGRVRWMVKFHEVSWDFDNFKGTTGWGQISVKHLRLALPRFNPVSSAGESFYINVVTFDSTGQPLWVIENMYIPGRTGCDDKLFSTSSRMTRFFSLEAQKSGRSQPLSWLNGVIVLASSHPAPLREETLREISQFPKTSFKISVTKYSAQGHLLPSSTNPRDGIDPPAGDPGPPPRPFDFRRHYPGGGGPPSTPSTDLIAPKCKFQGDTPNVQCARNQCVPMAVANTLQWLEDKYNSGPFFSWSLPDDHGAPGYGKTTNNVTWTAQVEESFDPNLPSLIAEIDKLTQRRSTTSFNTGRGSSQCQLYDGLFGYLNMHGLDAEFRHQGSNAKFGDGGSCDDDSHGSLTSNRVGNQPTWDWIYQELVDENGVFLVYGRYNDTGFRTGGHVLRVQGACRFGGLIDYLYLLDDGDQGSFGAELTNVIQVTPWRVQDTRGPGNDNIPNGQLNLGDTKWEIELAQSVRPIPTSLPFQGFP